jgi:hypothetical protein
MILKAEIVQQHAFRARRQRLFQLIEPVDLDRDAGHVPGEGARAGHRFTDRAAHGDMVVLDQDRVIQAIAMHRPAARAHRLQLHRPQARRGLAGMGDTAPVPATA